jgi:hypothetical protein
MGAAQVSLVSRDGWLEFDAEINDQTMQVARSEPYGDLADYGYQQVSGDSAARIRFNPEAGELEIATLSGSVDEVFGYEIAGKMVGIPKPGARMDPKSVALAEASVSFTNHGVVERLLAHQAEQKGMPVARFTEIQAAQAEQMGQRRGVAATGKKVADFIRDPDSLTLSMSPERPMGFQELMMRAMMQPRSLEQAAGLRLAVNQ